MITLSFTSMPILAANATGTRYKTLKVKDIRISYWINNSHTFLMANKKIY